MFKALKFYHVNKLFDHNYSPLWIHARNCQRSSKIVIVGGGAGGITMAARLAALGQHNISIIEPSEVHYYQPYFTLIGGGLKDHSSCQRAMKDIIPKNVEWIKSKVVSFNPNLNLIFLNNNDKVKYEFLIVAMGIKLAFNKIKGLPEAFATKGVCSNYSFQTVTKTTEAIHNFEEGNAIFTQPPNPIKCAGAPQKIMYLAEDQFTKMGKRNKTNIIFNTALNTIFSAPKYAAALRDVAKNKNITVNYLSNLLEIKAESREAIFAQLDEKGQAVGTKVFKYDMLHVTPPMEAPSAMKKSPLADSTGFMDVNKHTLQSTAFPNVFGIGDCTNIPTSKTAAAVAGQCGILTENIKAILSGKSPSKMYYGYTSCPLVTGHSKGILAEFDFSLEAVETLPINQAIQRYLFYLLKKDALPFIYWNLMLKGYWAGPGTIRKILHLGMK